MNDDVFYLRSRASVIKQAALAGDIVDSCQLRSIASVSADVRWPRTDNWLICVNPLFLDTTRISSQL